MEVVVDKTSLLLLSQREVVSLEFGCEIEILFLLLLATEQLLFADKLGLSFRCKSFLHAKHCSNLDVRVVLHIAHISITDGISALLWSILR